MDDLCFGDRVALFTCANASSTELKFHHDNLTYELIRAASGHATILDAKA
jgi:hypothetical protein